MQASVVPDVPQLCGASHQLASTPARCRIYPRQLGQGVAAVYPGDDSGVDGSRVVAARGAVLPGTAVASAVDGLKQHAR